MKHYLLEIEAALKRHKANRIPSQIPEAYIGGGQSKLRYLGLRVPQLRETMRVGFSFSEHDPDSIAKVWNFVWNNADSFEVMALGLDWFYNPKQRPILRKHWPKLKQWSARIDNWAHADTLSGIYARILEDDSETIYATLCKWNRSKEPWLRRLSIVSLLYYSSQRDKVLPLQKILALVEPQLEFDHYYVQKGVGWTLREAGNVYPEQTFAFLEENILRISTHAFSAATEKLSAPKKARLKLMRRAGK